MRNFLTQRLGIDLGTANTLVFLLPKGIVLNERTVVAVDKRANQVISVGEEAYTMVGKTPDDIIAYRPLKNGVIADYRITEAMLTYFIDRSLPKFSLIKPDVLISVPAGVTPTERDAVVEAGLKAGARNAYVAKEPILAAIGSGISIQEPTGRMIVDIGGGTTDVAIISLGGVVASQSLKCAGTRLDGTLVEFMKKEHGLIIGEQTAENIKIAAGSAIEMTDPITISVKGRSIYDGLPKNVTVTSNEIAEVLRPDLAEMIGAIKTVLQETPPELSADVIEHGIIMTGGSSLLRGFDTLIEQVVGVPTTVADQALFCVVNGTGVVLEHLDLYKQRLFSRY